MALIETQSKIKIQYKTTVAISASLAVGVTAILFGGGMLVAALLSVGSPSNNNGTVFTDKPQFSKEDFLSKNTLVQEKNYDGYIFITGEGELETNKKNLEFTQEQRLQTKGDIVRSNNLKIRQTLDLLSNKNKITFSELERKNLKLRFTTAIKGFSLRGISDQDAKFIEQNISGVKAYKNYEVKPHLFEVRPNHGFDTVHTMDTSGNQCEGEECVALRGQGMKVVVIDTGIDRTHPDLGGCPFSTNYNDGLCEKVAGGYSFVTPENPNDASDNIFHGTHVAGIIASTGASNSDLIGVAPEATLYSFKVFGGDRAFIDTFVEAVERTADLDGDGNINEPGDKADVVNMSLGGFGTPDSPLALAVDRVVDHGIIFVISAGNSGPGGNSDCWNDFESRGATSSICDPGTSRNAITVGATFKQNYTGQHNIDIDPKRNDVASFSSRGLVVWGEENNRNMLLKPDIVANGAYVCAARYNNVFSEGEHPFYYPCEDEYHVQISGTSMSAPVVAGAAAIIKQAHSDWTPREVKLAIRNTSENLDGFSFEDQGYGSLDILNAVGSLRPPEALLDLSGDVRGIVPIIGVVDEQVFEYTVSISHESDLTIWDTVCASNEISGDGILCDHFDTSTFVDGMAFLRLEVIDLFGTRSVDISPIQIRNIEITSPKKGHMVFENQTVPLLGSAFHTDMSTYQIYFNDSMVYEGNESIFNGLLHNLDISNIHQAGYYRLSMRVVKHGGETIYGQEVMIYIDPILRKDFKRSVGAEVYSFPVSGDVNGDGIDEIVIKDDLGRVHVLSPTSGNNIDGFPVQAGDACYGFCTSAPALADLDDDGRMEVIVQSFERGVVNGWNTWIDHVYIINHEGEKISVPLEHYSSPHHFVAAVDITNNGYEEIIATFSSGLIILDHQGNILHEYFTSLAGDTERIFSNPAFANLDNDLELEIIIGTVNYDTLERNIYALNYDGTYVFEPYSFVSDSGIYDRIIVGDIDLDDIEEIVIQNGNRIDVINGNDGSIQQGSWPITFIDGDYSLFYGVLANIDETPDLEILVPVVGLFERLSYISAYKFNGEAVSYASNSIYLGSLVASDIDNDTIAEIFSGNILGDPDTSLTQVSAWKNSNFFESWPKPIHASIFPLDTPMNGFIISDFDKDGDTDAFYVSTGGDMYMWDYSYQFNEGSVEWPYVRHDSANSGWYDYEPRKADSLFYRGNIDGNDKINANDVISLLQTLFEGGPQPSCQDSADVNDDGFIGVDDAVRLVLYLSGQVELDAPGNTLGPDPTEDNLDCEVSHEVFNNEPMPLNAEVSQEQCDTFEDLGFNAFEQQCEQFEEEPHIVHDNFIRGDANQDGKVDGADIQVMNSALQKVNSVQTLFITCEKSFDVNDDGLFDSDDPQYLLGYLFTGTKPQPNTPFPNEGQDKTTDKLTCNNYNVSVASPSPTPSISRSATPTLSPSPSPSASSSP